MAGEGYTAKWSDKNTLIFVNLMVEEVKKGNRTTTTFNKVGWKNIKEDFAKQTGLDYSMTQLKNKVHKLRSEYGSFKKLLSIPGFGWNPVLKTASTEDPSLWDIHTKDNPQWPRFRKNGLPYWEELVDIFGDVYASGDNAIGNAEEHQVSDGDDTNIPAVGNVPTMEANRQEYQEVEHVLEEGLFASEPVGGPSPGQHRLDRTPNAKRRRSAGNRDIEMTCKAIQDMVKSRENQCHHNFASSATAVVNEDPYSVEAVMDVLNDMEGLDNEVYTKAFDRSVESQAWRIAFMKAPSERRAAVLEKFK